VIQLDDERWWLYAAVDPTTNDLLHVRLLSTRTTQLTVLFLRELLGKQSLCDATILVDNAHHLTAALSGLGLRFQTSGHGNRNTVERVFREVKQCSFSFANTFGNVEPTTAETWL
jgi:putative transposase